MAPRPTEAGGPSGPPPETPIGLHLARVARTVGREFERTLAAAGGSPPTWTVLVSLKSGPARNQRELAEAAGIQGATLTHHLNGMEAAGLITRRRDPANRRVHVVELTGDGEREFLRLAVAASAFDERLRAGLSPAELEEVRRLLARLAGNAGGVGGGAGVGSIQPVPPEAEDAEPGAGSNPAGAGAAAD
jgi:MarR family transcriptional regulator for hemolysin